MANSLSSEDWVLVLNEELYIAQVQSLSGNKLILRTLSGKQRKERKDRILMKLSLSEGELHELHSRLSGLKDEVLEDKELHLLWELCLDEPREYTLEELLELISAELGSFKSAIFTAKLIYDTFRFKLTSRNPIKVIPLSPHEHLERKHKYLLAKEKERKIQLLASALSKILKEDRELRDLTEEERSLINETLTDLENAIKGLKDSDTIKPGELLEKALKRIGVSFGKALALKLLHKLREPNFSSLLLQMYSLPLEFPDNVLKAAEKLSANFPKRIEEERLWRISWEDLYTFSVDDETTEDYDDAIVIPSSELDGPPWEVWLAISDPSSLISKDSCIYSEAIYRYSTIYLPDIKVNMFPKEISTDKASLVAGEPRLAIGVKILIYDDGKIELLDVQPVIVNVNENMTYSKLDGLVYQGRSPFKDLYEIALRIRGYRVKSGGVILSLPQLKVKIINGQLVINRYNLNTPANVIVSEFMIALNYAISKLFKEYNLPAIYRVQDPPPPEFEDLAREFNGVIDDIVKMRRLARYLPRTYFSVLPGRHYLLGVDSYLQFTSPLRRSFDLINHFQLNSFIRKCEPTFSPDELREMINSSITTMKSIEVVSHRAETFWLYTFLMRELPVELEGVVTDVGRYLNVYVEELCLDIKVSNPFGEKIEVGELVKIQISEVDPYIPSLKGRILDKVERLA